MENKLKSENYNSAGGINTKISQYLAPKTEFLNLQNVDFRKYGALSTFAGTANYNYTSLGARLTGIEDFYSSGATYGYGSATYSLIVTGPSQSFNVTGLTSVIASGATPIYSNFAGGNNTPFSFVSANQVYACNQYDFFKYPLIGSTQQFASTTYGIFINGATVVFAATYQILPLPSITDYTRGVQYSLPKPHFATFSLDGASAAAGVSGILDFYAAFVRSDWFIGPATHVTAQINNFITASIRLPALNPYVGATYRSVTYTDFDIIGMHLWYSQTNIISGLLPLSVNLGATLTPGQRALFGTTFCGSTFIYHTANVITDFVFGYTSPSTDFLGTFIYGLDPNNGSSLSFINAPSAPSTVEIYNNQMFFSGFFEDPDIVWYSDIGEYEVRNNENSFRVRSKDGDIVTCIRAYFTQVLFFKQRSITVLTGDDPDNFSITEVTNQFGAINARCAIIWNQRCWFLDIKGVCEFNGANTAVVSNKVENIFKNMNMSAAKIMASMLHVKERNEVWISVPTGSNVFCDTLVVYDIIADAWTTRKLSSGTALGLSKENTKKQVPFYGNFIGQLRYFDDNLYSETILGVTVSLGFTQIIKSRFIGDLGYSVEKQFRRLYTDIDVPSGLTYDMKVNFYKDQGISPVLSMTFAMTEFQKRIDFGIPAKEIAMEWIYAGTSALLFNGFTIEYRLQREV